MTGKATKILYISKLQSFEERREPKRNRTKVLPLTILTPYRQARPARPMAVDMLNKRFFVVVVVVVVDVVVVVVV